MKSAYFALILGVFVFVFTFAGAKYMSNVSDTMLGMSDDFTSDGIEKIEKYWDKHKNMLMALANHKNCEEISRSIVRLKNYVSGGDKYYHDATSELGVFRELCKDLREYEELKFFNVF